MLCCTSNVGSFGCEVLLVSLSALPQTLGVVVTAAFSRKVFRVLLLASLVCCPLSGFGDLIGFAQA